MVNVVDVALCLLGGLDDLLPQEAFYTQIYLRIFQNKRQKLKFLRLMVAAIVESKQSKQILEIDVCWNFIGI